MRRNNFDLLRLYLAFIVVLGHLCVLSDVAIFKKFLPYFNTYISVTGFFCISGFLITRSFVTTTSVQLYFKKRAARLLPAYILVIVLSSVLLYFVSTYNAAGYFLNPAFFKYLFSNLFFLNFLAPCLPGVFMSNPLACWVNPALWTLKVEVLFYLIVPLLIYVLDKSKHKFVVIIIIYLLSILYRNILLHAGSNSLEILSRQLPGFMSYFSCGIALFYYFEYFKKNKNSLLILALILFFAEKYSPYEIVTPLALSIIVFFVAFSFPALNSIIKFGDISYGIYIFHAPIIQTVTHFNLFNRYNPYLVAVGTITVIILISLVSWHLIEKKFLDKVRTRPAVLPEELTEIKTIN